MKKLRPQNTRQRSSTETAPASAPSAPPATGAVDSSADSADGINRRRSAREPVVTLGTLHTIGRADGTDNIADVEGEIISSDLQIAVARPMQVLVTNVSLHGVGFRCPQKLDDELLYSMQIGVGPLHLSSRLRLVRVRSRADGTYDIGAEFC